MYNFAEIFLKSLFIMRQFTILHLNFVCSHCNLKLYLVKTWDFSMMGQLIKQKRRKHRISFCFLGAGWCCVMWKIFTCVFCDWTIDFSSPNMRQKEMEKKEKKIYWKWPSVWICSIHRSSVYLQHENKWMLTSVY